VLETAIIKKTGIAAWPILSIRLGTAFAAGAVLNLVGHLMPS
jgi:hypothetical protein